MEREKMAQLSANGPLFDNLEAGGPPLRHALRALASEPDFLLAPHHVIARLRPRVYAEERRIAQRSKIWGSLDERLRSWTRLADGAIIGLSHLARLSVDAQGALCGHPIRGRGSGAVWRPSLRP
jgi:hypothetical protein